MAKQIENTIHYLQSPNDYFWNWVEDSRVIAWRVDGLTICYREVLFQTFRQMTTPGLPRLGALLLAFHTCQHNIGPREGLALVRTLGVTRDRTSDPKVLKVLNLLKNIRALPIELRSGESRSRLLSELFAESEFILGKEDFLSIAPDLEAGSWSSDYSVNTDDSTADALKADLDCLEKAFQRFPTAESLEIKLRTGLERLPEPVEIPEPETTFAYLLDQLLEDPKTAATARITKNLLPVIHIPMHSLSAGDLPIGGISDITNRGNYDKLLLSELAQDELLLTARLVNNEALYFRREEPPQHPKRKKIILIDSTIRMWGIPRVYAVAAALAFARNCKHGEEVEAYVLGAKEHKKVSLTDEEGVITALEYLHHGLHPGEALVNLIRDLAGEEANEFVFITEDRQLLSPAFHAAFSKIREALSFFITLNRDGNIRFAELVNGRSTVLNEAKLDISQLITPPERIAKRIPVKYTLDNSRPSFLRQTPLPLLVPKKRIIYGQTPVAAGTDGGVVAINANQRVLFFSSKESGALEMLPFIEQGTYYFNWSDPDICYIVVRNRKILKLYQFDLENLTVVQEDFFVNVPEAYDVIFARNQRLYLVAGERSIVYDCGNMKQLGKTWRDDFGPLASPGEIPRNQELPLTKLALREALYTPKHLAITKVNRIHISSTGRLVINHFELIVLKQSIYFSIQPGAEQSVLTEASFDKQDYFKGTKCKYQRWFWRDGSEACLDKRGFLHLRSSDSDMPEITILLAAQIPVACWASTNELAGAAFSINTGDEMSGEIAPLNFFDKYIQPFVNHIMSHAVESST